MNTLELIKQLKGIVLVDSKNQQEIKGGEGDPPPYPYIPPPKDGK